MGSARGRDVVAIPDSKWDALAADAEGNEAKARARQRNWLSAYLTSFQRQEFLRETNLTPEIVERLNSVPLGEGGVSTKALQELGRYPLHVQNKTLDRFLQTWQLPRITDMSGWLIGIVKREGADAAAAQAKVEKQQVKEEKKDQKRKEWEESEAGKATGKDEDSGPAMKQKGARHAEANMGSRAQAGQKLAGAVQSTKAAKPASTVAEESTGTKSSSTRESLSPKRANRREGFAMVERPTGGWGHKDAKPLSELKVGSAVKGVITNTLHRRIWIDIGYVRDASLQFSRKDEVSALKLNKGDTFSDCVVQEVDLDKQRIILAYTPSST